MSTIDISQRNLVALIPLGTQSQSSSRIATEVEELECDDGGSGKVNSRAVCGPILMLHRTSTLSFGSAFVIVRVLKLKGANTDKEGIENIVHRNIMKLIYFFLVIVLVPSLTGCKDSIPAVDISDQDTYFSLYGYFLTGADTSFVRVVPFRETLARPEPAPLEVEVFSEDLQLGRTIYWKDSLVENDDGSFGHVFWSDDLNIRPGHTYGFYVRRPDGKQTHAIASTPSKPGGFEVEEPYRDAGYKQRIEWVTNGLTMLGLTN